MPTMRKTIGMAAATGMAALAALMVGPGSAQAAASCAGPGYLCFYDYQSQQYGNVAGSNRAWSAFGWNDRADWFYNQGTSCNVRLYRDRDYNENSLPWFKSSYITLDRGQTASWTNEVSSNKWCV